MVAILQEEDELIVMKIVIIHRRLRSSESDVSVGVRSMSDRRFVSEKNLESEMTNSFRQVLFLEYRGANEQCVEVSCLPHHSPFKRHVRANERFDITFHI